MTQAPNSSSLSEITRGSDLTVELNRLEGLINELKVEYEHFFLGIKPIMPDKLHAEVKRLFRQLRKAPFRNSALNYRLRAIENRYNTFNSYWLRTIKQKEEGTYSRDVFKAELRQKAALEEERSQTAVGKAEKGIVHLFNAYKEALEKQTGKAQSLNYEAFKDNLLKRAQDFKKQNGVTKLSFKVVVADGKVKVQAKGKGG